MAYSERMLRRMEMGKQYVEKFGPVPSDLGKWAADSGQVAGIDRAIEDALRTGKPISNWDDYVTPYHHYN